MFPFEKVPGKQMVPVEHPSVSGPIQPEDFHTSSMPVCFCGVGSDLFGITHYRSLVPARALGCTVIVQDAVGRVWHWEREFMSDPEILVMQMPVFPFQLDQIRMARAEGKKVFANVDDYIPSLRKQHKRGAHAHGNAFDREVIERHKQCLRECDGILCSTEWLAKKYSSLNKTYLFQNGLDLDRYRMEDVEKDVVAVGWAGGTGHVRAFMEIVPAITEVFSWPQHKDVVMVIQGDNAGYHLLDGLIEPKRQRLMWLKWEDLHLYPRSTKGFSVNLAPGEENDFYRAKSQLRFYESAALGVPLIAHPMYDEVRHGVDGFIAKDRSDWIEYIDLLISEPELAAKMGRAGQDRAFSEFGAQHRVPAWCDALGVEVPQTKESNDGVKVNG